MKKRFIIEGILLVLILTFFQGCAPQATPSAVNTAVPEPATQVNTANTAIPATDSIQAASDTPTGYDREYRYTNHRIDPGGIRYTTGCPN